MKFSRRSKWAGVALFLLMIGYMLLPSPVADFMRLRELHARVEDLCPGLKAEEVIRLIGHPDGIATGSTPDESGVQVSTTVWEYRTHYDWDGIRTRWNDQWFIPYWVSRASPVKAWDIDDVLSIHIADDAIVATYQEDLDDGILFRMR